MSSIAAPPRARWPVTPGYECAQAVRLEDILIAGATSGLGRRLDALRRISDTNPEIDTVALDVAPR
jgi:hypothetical protein